MAIPLILSIADPQVCHLTPTNHYFVPFLTIGTILLKHNTDITWRRDIRSINKSDLVFSLKDSGLLYRKQCTYNQPDEFADSENLSILLTTASEKRLMP